MDREKQRKRLQQLANMESPERPRAKRDSFADAIAKAKKYDELIKQLKKDREILEEDLKAYKNSSHPLKFGYTNGYVDGKIAALQNMDIRYGRYLEG